MVANFSRIARGVSPRRPRSGQVFQRHVQTVRDEGDEDVRLDPILALMEDRPDGQIVLQFLERLLDLAELHVVAPQCRRVLAGEVGTQQITGPRGAGLGAAAGAAMRT